MTFKMGDFIRYRRPLPQGFTPDTKFRVIGTNSAGWVVFEDAVNALCLRGQNPVLSGRVEDFEIWTEPATLTVKRYVRVYREPGGTLLAGFTWYSSEDLARNDTVPALGEFVGVCELSGAFEA